MKNGTRYKPYPRYKDSSVEWLGTIPESWRVSKIKHETDFTVGWTPPTGTESYFNGNNPWITIGDLLGRKEINDTSQFISDEAVARSRLRKSPKGSLLFSFKLSIGIVAFAGIDLFTNEAIATFVASPGVRTDFLYYAAPVYITENADTNIYGAKLLNQELIKNAVIVCPSVEEQRAIADFLDRETAKIDALIAKKERLIELLEEKRAALITHAVTRGLNSDASLRDSGIKWLGQIPKHWALRRLKRLAKRIQTGSTPPTADQSYYQTEEVPWFGPGSFGRAFTLTNPTKLISESAIADGVAR